MQPTYLPWSGYFNLIARSDKFVFLDDVQYQKNSWHNRNQLLVNKSPHWVTVPIKHKSLSQTIKDSEIDQIQHWRRKHSFLIKNVYSKHPFFNDISDICSFLEEDNSKFLADLNIKLIRWFLDKLTIQTEIFLSSDIPSDGKRSSRLISILKHLMADTYLSPVGAMNYLQEDNFVGTSDINLLLQNFSPQPYQQYRHLLFESHLSIIDVVANLGWQGTRVYIS